MPLLVNLRHLEAGNVRLQGELPADELDIDARDDVVRANQPLHYDLDVQELEDALLLQGHLRLVLDCLCVRCLKPLKYSLDLKPWACHIPLEGEDQAPVVNDCVDLTPFVREDILLEFPRHPLCNPECRGLPGVSAGKAKQTGRIDRTEAGSPAWSELNKLKL